MSGTLPNPRIERYTGANQEVALSRALVAARDLAELGYQPSAQSWEGTTLVVTYTHPSSATAAPPSGRPPVGQPQWNQAPVPQWSQPASTPQPPKKQGSTLGGLILIALIGIGVWYFFLRSPSTPSAGSPQRGATPAAVAPAAAFTDITLTGRGDSVQRFTIPASSAAIVTLSHRGSSNFIVESLDTSGGTNDLLVNTIGNYSGTRFMDTSAGEHSSALEIQADGPWTITIKHPTKARSWSGSGALSGNGDDVVRVSPTVSGFTAVTLSHSGDSNFIVTSYANDGTDLVVNEIGSYRGSKTLPSGTYAIEVEADGSWSITPQ
jgi:hypothetical protein